MAVAFGIYELAPAVFWAMTLPEFRALERGRRMLTTGGHEPLTRDEYEEMKAQHG